jgi:septum formation protein
LAVVRQADGMQLVAAETCQSVFKPYDARAVAEYVATGDGLDKAGGYGLQSGGAVLVDHFEGRLDTIIGLPTQLLSDYLAVLGVESKAVDAEELYSFYSQD